MEDTKLSKLDRFKVKFEENKTAIAAGVGFTAGIAVTLWTVRAPIYNPAQPIPTLLLSEEDIKRRVVAGIMYDLFVQKKDLKDEFVAFVDLRVEEAMKQKQ